MFLSILVTVIFGINMVIGIAQHNWPSAMGRSMAIMWHAMYAYT